jgi:NAD-dependent SIR2 family protein deacetylase
MSTTKEPLPGDFYHGVECAKCGERTRPNALEKVPDGFLATCEKCQHKQTYSLSELKQFQWFPSGDQLSN